MTKKGMDGVKLQVILPRDLVEDLNGWADKIGMPLGTLLRTILIWARNKGDFPLAPNVDLNKLRGGE